MSDELVIAVDGPVGAGKSAVARALAKRLGFRYLDTGAMYRAVTLKAIREGTDMADGAALTAVAESCDIELIVVDDGLRVMLDGEDVSREIRSLEVTNNAHAPAGTPGVRRRMVELQRRAAEQGPLVAEGRDMGTVVFADSPAKFYLDASADERARRRHAEHVAKGEDISIEELKEQIVLRDKRDSEREASPLRQSDDAIRIDSSDLDIDGVVDAIVSVLRDKGLARGA
jgi:CMP/dCMP kinase